MNKTTRKILGIISAMLIIALTAMTGVYTSKADGASVSVWASGNANLGDDVSVSVSVSGGDISAYTIYVSYDSSVLTFNSGSGAIVNGSDGSVIISGTSAADISLSFTAVGTGTSSISTSGEFYDIDFNELSVSYGSDSVKVTKTTEATTETPSENTQATTQATTRATTEDTRSSNCNLYTLEVSEGTLEPEFSASTTYYEMRVAEDVTYIEISAYAADSNASIRVSDNDNIEPGENKMYVTVVAENGDTKTYTIRVVAGELLSDNVVTVNGVKYNLIDDYSDIMDSIDIPDGYEETTVKYESWDIPAFSYDDKAYIVCLQDSQGNVSPFIYSDGNFYRYALYSLNNNRYLITDIPEDAVLSDEYHNIEVEIEGETIKALKKDGLDDACYIIYAINLDGEEGFYIYDSVEGTIMRYTVISDENIATGTDATATDATQTDSTTDNDDGKLTTENPVLDNTSDATTESESDVVVSKKLLTSVLVVIGIILLVLIVLLIVFVIRYKAIKAATAENEKDNFVDELWKLDGDEAETETADSDEATDSDENDDENADDASESEADAETAENDNDVETDTKDETAAVLTNETAEISAVEEAIDEAMAREAKAASKETNETETPANKDLTKEEQVNQDLSDSEKEQTKADSSKEQKAEDKKAADKKPADKKRKAESATSSIDALNKKIDQLMEANAALWAEEKLKEDKEAKAAGNVPDGVEEIKETKKKKSSFDLFDAED